MYCECGDATHATKHVATWLSSFNTGSKRHFWKSWPVTGNPLNISGDRMSSRWQGSLGSENRSGVRVIVNNNSASEVNRVLATAGDMTCHMQRQRAAAWTHGVCSILQKQRRSVRRRTLCGWEGSRPTGTADADAEARDCLCCYGGLLSILWSGARRQPSRTLRRTAGKADGWAKDEKRERGEGRRRKGVMRPARAPFSRRAGSARAAGKLHQQRQQQQQQQLKQQSRVWRLQQQAPRVAFSFFLETLCLRRLRRCQLPAVTVARCSCVGRCELEVLLVVHHSISA